MSVAASIRKLGFRRWHERQLIEAHASLVTAFLCVIVIAVCLDQFHWRESGAKPWIMLALIVAAGEYVSVRSQREMFEYQIGLEKEELDHYPEEEAEELALIYQARGLPREDAVRLATQLTADPARALDTLAREELGLNPDDLGSPWGAALFSFTAFAIGASVPLLPFLVASGTRSMAIAISLTAIALFGVGATLSLFTGRNAWWSGTRMLSIGVAAGAVTYMIGKMLGVSLS